MQSFSWIFGADVFLLTGPSLQSTQAGEFSASLFSLALCLECHGWSTSSTACIAWLGFSGLLVALTLLNYDESDNLTLQATVSVSLLLRRTLLLPRRRQRRRGGGRGAEAALLRIG
jgi:hypothetical protein